MHYPTMVSNWMCAIDVMKVKDDVHMNEFVKSFTPLVFTTSGGMGRASKSLTSVLLPCAPSNVNNRTVLSWDS